MKSKTASKARAVEVRREEPELLPVTLPEFKLRQILVPIDFSEPSRKALHYAGSFARQFRAEILALHVVEPVLPVSPYMMSDLTAIETEPAEDASAKRLAEWCRGAIPTVRARTSVRCGLPSHEIIRAAEENNIELIIISRRGRTGLAHLLLGGTAEYVLRHAPCPTLVVRDREHDFIATAEEQEAHHASMA